jgi:DNA-binding NtrC family response regulator
MRILIVDDEGSLLMTLAANLELEGFEVSCASGGERALELVSRERFDLVLTDVRMPGMNGVELFRRIRSVDRGLPVILMTAFAVEALIEEAITEGVFAVLPKPFEIEHVIAAVVRASRRPAVLLVDDEAEAERTAEAVSAMGVACRASRAPSEVLCAVQERRVDVCVVDVACAAARGAELVAQILQADGSIAVIAVGVDPAAAVLRRAASFGAFACMKKPFRPAELVHLVASARARWPPPRAHSTHSVRPLKGDIR